MNSSKIPITKEQNGVRNSYWAMWNSNLNIVSAVVFAYILRETSQRQSSLRALNHPRNRLSRSFGLSPTAPLMGQKTGTSSPTRNRLLEFLNPCCLCFVSVLLFFFYILFYEKDYIRHATLSPEPTWLLTWILIQTGFSCGQDLGKPEFDLNHLMLCF